MLEVVEELFEIDFTLAFYRCFGCAGKEKEIDMKR